MGLNNAKENYLAETLGFFPMNFCKKFRNSVVSIFKHCFFFLIQKTLEFV